MTAGATAHFDVDEASLQRWARGPDMARAVLAIADRVEDRAKQLAPKGATLRLSTDMTTSVWDNGRSVCGRVTADDFKAGWHEFGTVKMAPHPFLWPATELVGKGA